MPELPEVETTRRCVEPELMGARIVAAEAARPRMLRRQPRARDFADRLAGRTIESVGRHGKFLLTAVEGDVTWITHLGMSGRVAMVDVGAEKAPHTNVTVHLDTGREFRLIDPRTFGFVAAFTPEELADSPMSGLGPDAYTDLPRAPALARTLDGRTAPIKALLLDQRIVAGVGNIYADEALHRAGIRPDRPGGSLLPAELSRLRTAIKAVLDAGLRHGGTSLDDLAYLLPDGRAGEYVDRLRVYGRDGAPCRTCGSEIRRTVLRQRSTHWCGTCQT